MQLLTLLIWNLFSKKKKNTGATFKQRLTRLVHSENNPQDEREKKLRLTSGSEKMELRCNSGFELDCPTSLFFFSIVIHLLYSKLTWYSSVFVYIFFFKKKNNYCHSLSGPGAVAVTLLLIGQMLRVPVQRRQRVREAEFHELHEPGEASSFEGSASLESKRERWSVTFVTSAEPSDFCVQMCAFVCMTLHRTGSSEDVTSVS